MSEPTPIGGERPCLVVGYDGSEESRGAVLYAVRRLGGCGTLVMVHAAGALPDWPGAEQARETLEAAAAKAEEMLTAAQEGAPSPADVEVVTELAHDEPAQALARIAEERGANEIVVGSRGFGGARASLGSVSHELISLADRPVVVIPIRGHESPS